MRRAEQDFGGPTNGKGTYAYASSQLGTMAWLSCFRARPAHSIMYDFATLSVSLPASCVLHVQINRPAKVNAMNAEFWVEFAECFQRIGEDTDVRAVVVSGIGERVVCPSLNGWRPSDDIMRGTRRVNEFVEKLNALLETFKEST